ALPQEKKQTLRQKAQEILENLEDDSVKDMSSKLDDNPAETHQEHQKRIDKDKELRVKDSLLKEMEDLEDRIKATESPSGYYDKVYKEIKEVDEDLYRRLDEIFHPNLKRDIKLKSSGPRINLQAVFRWEVNRAVGNPSMDNKIFETTNAPKKRDYVFTVLVDLSGSMRGQKIKETFKGVILLTEVLNRLGIKNEILGFQDKVIKFKDFDEELTDEVRDKISGMVDEVDGSNLGGNNHPGYNDDGPSLTEASKTLSKQFSKNKFLLALSDGIPEGRFSSAQDLHTAIKFILTNTDQKLVGIGLGPDTEHVKEFYPTSLPNVNIKKLPETFGDLLEDMILNPQRYEQKSQD
ncbi:MAG: hypothetical protein Q8O32_03490, partial [bacterium]|nr:hypothetical protein [bacterium]